MSTKARYRSLILCGLSAVAVVLGYVVFPGCTGGPDALSASRMPTEPESEQHRFYAKALSFLEKKKSRGELPGLDPADAGTFSGTWLWYDHAHWNGDHRIVWTFTYADRRPARRFEMVYDNGWQLVPLSKR